jgi:hypothetical protein
VLLFCQVPGSLWGSAQFAMGFMAVAVVAQVVDMAVGLFQIGDLFAGKIGWEPFLPKLMFPLDFAFGLGSRSIEETNVIELERPAQLGQGLRGLREKDAVVIHVELQRPAVGQEGGWQEIEVGQEQFPVIKFRADEKAAAVIEHVEHREVERELRKPRMRRGIQLPEFADLRALPAAYGRVRTLGGHWVSVIILQGPTANLGPVELERVEAQGFGSDKAIGAGRGAAQALFEQAQNGRRPRRSMIPAGTARDPDVGHFVRAGFEVFGAQGIESAAGNLELVCRFGGAEPPLAKTLQNVTNEGGRMPMEQLLVLFKKVGSTRAAPRASHFVGLRFAPASSMTGPWGPPIHIRHTSCVLLC